MEPAGRSKRDDEYDAPHRDSRHSPRNESSEVLEGIEDSSVDEAKTCDHSPPVTRSRCLRGEWRPSMSADAQIPIITV